jgi:hypothetical protein
LAIGEGGGRVHVFSEYPHSLSFTPLQNEGKEQSLTGFAVGEKICKHFVGEHLGIFTKGWAQVGHE